MSPSNKTHSILGLIPVFEVLAEQGIDPDAILEKRGVSLEGMTGGAVIEQTLELEIIDDAIAMLENPILGAEVGNKVSFTSYGIYAMLLMTAEDFHQSSRVGVQFQALSLLFSTMSLHINQEWAELRYTFPDASPRLRAFMADRDFMGSYVFIREFIPDAKAVLLGAGVARPRPDATHYQHYKSVVDVDVQYDEPYNWFRFPRQVMATRQVHANYYAHRLYRIQAHDLMRRFHPEMEDVVAQVARIIEGYEKTYPSLPDVARLFGVSESTLRRKLEQAGASYRQLLDRHRKKRALDMLSIRQMAVQEMSETLGYAEPASFLRAFKRWTGTTPKAYLRDNRSGS